MIGDEARGASAPADFDAALQGRIVDAVRRFGDRLGPSVRPIFGQLVMRLQIYREQWPTYFFHPRALPVAQLPVWVADALARAGTPAPDGAVFDAVESGVMGYLAVRLQDDLIDEGVGDPGETVLLATLLMARHQRLLVNLAGSVSFWDGFEATWGEYADSMLLEARLHRGAGVEEREHFDHVLGRSQPLALPAAALLHFADRHRDVPTLCRFVRHLTAAHQLWVDLLDAEKDLSNTNRTWIVHRFAQGDDPASLRQRLYVGGGIGEVVAEARVELAAAREAADVLGLTGAIVALDDRESALVRLEEGAREAVASAWSGHLGALLGEGDR